MFDNLDICVQLHEEIQVHYYVDHYAAQLWTLDGQRMILEGKGDDVLSAMADLNKLCESKTWSDIRKLPTLKHEL